MSSRLRLLVTTSDLVGRGAERELVNLLRRIPRDRFDLHLCLWRGVFDYAPPDDVPVAVLDKRRWWHVFRTRRRLARLIDELRPDLVYSQLNYVGAVTGSALAAARSSPRWICRLAGNPTVEIRQPVLAWTRRSLRRADFVVGCSRGAARSIEVHLRIPPQRVRVLPNVVDVDEATRLAEAPSPIQKPPGAFVYAAAGRLTPQKNYPLLLDAFAAAARPGSELWILGEGPLRDSLQRRARNLGVADRVRWLGFQKNPFAVLRAADAFVLSSDYEGLPNALIEAMLCGLPAVSTDCAFGPAELIEDGLGLLVPVGDARALGRAMLQLWEDRDAARRMGRDARNRVAELLNPDRIVPQYLDLFEECARSIEQGAP